MRRELKYLVHESDRERLHARIAPFVRPDARASGPDRPCYTVRSIYFDTTDLRDYREKMSGIQVRRKLRVRAYDQPGGSPVFLEVKRKDGKAVWKDRAALPADTVARLLTGGAPVDLVPPKDRAAARRFLFRIRREARRPTLLVTYDREPLVGRLDPSLRVTFDRRLRCEGFPTFGPGLGGLYRERNLRPVLDDRFILEVKFDRVFPSWFRSILADFKLSKQALSKYCLGLAHEAELAPWRYHGRSAVRGLSALGIA